MGCWGSGIFENDGACDQVCTIIEKYKTTKILEEQFLKFIKNGECKWDVEDTLASCEAVSVLHGQRSSSHNQWWMANDGSDSTIGDVLRAWAKGKRGTKKLSRLAIKCIDIALTKKFVKDMCWINKDCENEWKQNVRNLRRRLKKTLEK